MVSEPEHEDSVSEVFAFEALEFVTSRIIQKIAEIVTNIAAGVVP